MPTEEIRVAEDGEVTEHESQAMHRDKEASPAAWADLRQSLHELSQLATGRVALEETLTTVAQLAVRAVPGAEGVGLTLLEADRPDVMVSTADFVTAVDAVQYGIGQGPCISAAAEGVTVQSPALGIDSRWPEFGAKVADLDVHSALSIPLIAPSGVVGAMNIYARRRHAFSEQSAELGQLFASPAAIAVQNAHILAQAQRLATQLKDALTGRSAIDQAIGILMSHTGVTADAALQKLRTMSIAQQKKLHVVAVSVVEQAVTRARSRRAGQG